MGRGRPGPATFGPRQPIALNTSLGLDYLEQEKGGPSQWNVTYDAVVQPGGGGTVTPYAGGSVGANWSTEDAKRWEGARFGLIVQM